ncbi:MAG: hypothetical protein R2716_05405 [Microthrixaceae bacterium]
MAVGLIGLVLLFGSSLSAVVLVLLVDLVILVTLVLENRRVSLTGWSRNRCHVGRAARQSIMERGATGGRPERGGAGPEVVVVGGGIAELCAWGAGGLCGVPIDRDPSVVVPDPTPADQPDRGPALYVDGGSTVCSVALVGGGGALTRVPTANRDTSCPSEWARFPGGQFALRDKARLGRLLAGVGRGARRSASGPLEEWLAGRLTVPVATRWLPWYGSGHTTPTTTV